MRYVYTPLRKRAYERHAAMPLPPCYDAAYRVSPRCRHVVRDDTRHVAA